jgi:selenophosphate synthetase-related protein
MVIKKIYEDDINSMIIEKESIRIITKDSKILSCGLIQGDTIIFRGDFKCRSNAPKNCIKYKFDELNKNKVVNYFSCEKCGLNCNI